MPCGKPLTSVKSSPSSPSSIPHIHRLLSPFHIFHMENTATSETTSKDVILTDFVEQEESSLMVMESPKRESLEWTDEKHSLYLKSIEASFVDQLYNSLDMRSLQTQNESVTDSMSSRKIHASARYPSGQFKVLQHGCWSRIKLGRENMVHNEADKPHFSSGNPWIQHFRNGSRHGDVASPSLQELPSLTAKTQQFPISDSQLCCQQTSCSDAEVIDQNFVEDDSAIEKVNTSCSKKRMRTADSESGNDQAASFWNVSCNRSR